MSKHVLRVGVVGSSSLVGKELVEELADSVLGVVEVILLDQDVEVGQVATAGDGVTFVQRIEKGSFDGMDLCFFAGSVEDTLQHWLTATGAGAGVVDLTGALHGQSGIVIRAPWVHDAQPVSMAGVRGSGSNAVVPAHPVAVMLGLVAAHCVRLGLSELAATVFEPASERGAAGLDEMHQQTVRLLSFQSVPREEYDTQVAFNMLASLGAEARVSMQSTANQIRVDYHSADGDSQAPMTLQLIHAPVFHGYAVSLLLDFEKIAPAEELTKVLGDVHIQIIQDGEEGPSNTSAAGQKKILMKIGAAEGKRLWVWMVADNLKMRVLQGIACANELLALRLHDAVH